MDEASDERSVMDSNPLLQQTLVMQTADEDIERGVDSTKLLPTQLVTAAVGLANGTPATSHDQLEAEGHKPTSCLHRWASDKNPFAFHSFPVQWSTADNTHFMWRTWQHATPCGLILAWLFIGLGTAVCALSLVAWLRTSFDKCDSLLCNPLQISDNQIVGDATRHIDLKKLAVSFTYTNGTLLHPGLFVNGSLLAVAAEHLTCSTWSAQCIAAPISLVPCPKVAGSYQSDIADCATDNCRNHLQALVQSSSVLCFDPRNATKVNSFDSRIRISVQKVMEQCSAGVCDAQISKVRLAIGTIDEYYRINNHGKGFQESFVDIDVIYIGLLSQYTKLASLLLSVQEVTFVQWPFNSAVVQHTYVAQRDDHPVENLVGLDGVPEGACSESFADGSCLVALEIKMDKIVHQVYIRHMGIFEWLATIGGVISLIKMFGEILKWWNRRDYKQKFNRRANL